MLHDDMLCDPIQVQGHGGPKVVKTADLKVYPLRRYACNQKTKLNISGHIFDIYPRSASRLT